MEKIFIQSLCVVRGGVICSIFDYIVYPCIVCSYPYCQAQHSMIQFKWSDRHRKYASIIIYPVRFGHTIPNSVIRICTECLYIQYLLRVVYLTKWTNTDILLLCLIRCGILKQPWGKLNWIKNTTGLSGSCHCFAGGLVLLIVYGSGGLAF